MPVKLLAPIFRGKFLAYLKQAYKRGELTCQGRLRALDSLSAMNRWLTPLYEKNWVVYAKPPWNGPENALKYLARYTHRVAIANSRIQSIDDGQVSFSYKDYRHQSRQSTLTLTATEFMRRFMMHVLPNGFKRIRYFGFLANRHRREQLRTIRKLLGVAEANGHEQAGEDEPAECLSTPETQRCPHCKQGWLAPTEFTPRPTLMQLLALPLLAPT